MDLEKLLRSALVPCEPGPKAEVAVMARIARRSRPRRRVVITSVLALALAVAAAMLTVSLRDSVAPAQLSEVTAEKPAAIPAHGLLVEAAPAVESIPAHGAIQPSVSDEPDSSESVHDVKPATIYVLPLQHLVADERSKAAVELFYSSLLAGLGAVPGMTVVIDPLPPEYPRPRSDYRLTVKGGGSLPGDKFQIVLVVGERKIDESRFNGSSIRVIKGDIGNECATACTDPISLAASAVAQLADRGFGSESTPARALPTDFERTEQYRLWMARVEKGSPLESLINAAYAGIDRGTWSYATTVMEVYDSMMSSPDDHESGRSLELDIQNALKEIPPEARQGFRIWPAKCRLAMCSIQLAEAAPGELNVASGLIMKALRDKGLMSDDPKSPIAGARMPTGRGTSFWFLTRREENQSDVE